MKKKITLIGAGQIGGTLAHLIGLKELVDEVFGPFSLFVKCSSIEQMNELAKIIPGQLTGTILSDKNDQVYLKKLVLHIFS